MILQHMQITYMYSYSHATMYHNILMNARLIL